MNTPQLVFTAGSSNTMIAAGGSHSLYLDQTQQIFAFGNNNVIKLY
jgi:hypothetical protein